MNNGYYLSKEAAFLASDLGSNASSKKDERETNKEGLDDRKKSEKDMENEEMWVYCYTQIERAAYGLVSNEAPYRNEINSLRPWFYLLPERQRAEIEQRVKKIEQQVKQQLKLDQIISDHNTSGSKPDGSMTSNRATVSNTMPVATVATQNKPTPTNSRTSQTLQTQPSVKTPPQAQNPPKPVSIRNANTGPPNPQDRK